MGMNETSKVDVSLIIPVYNEGDGVQMLYDEVKKSMESLGRSYEILFIEDGSKDNSWEKLKAVTAHDDKVRLLRHGRNLGQTHAYQNGFDHARGEYMVIFSSDLETEGKYIHDVVKKMDEGFDVVNTHRIGRWQETKSSAIIRAIPSAMANEMIVRVTGVRLKDGGSGLKGFRRYVAKNLHLSGEMHRFFASYASVITNKITEIEVPYRDRMYGKSSVSSLSRTFKVFLDLFALKFLVSQYRKPYSLLPGRLFGSIGMVLSGLGVLISVLLVADKLIFKASIGDRPLLTFAVLFIILGVQLIITGFLGELMLRIYFETGGRKIYTNKELVNFEGVEE